MQRLKIYARDKRSSLFLTRIKEGETKFFDPETRRKRPKRLWRKKMRRNGSGKKMKTQVNGIFKARSKVGQVMG